MFHPLSQINAKPATIALPARRLHRLSRPCWDCGTIIAGEHSAHCDLAPPHTHRLPYRASQPETQYLSPATKAAQVARLAAQKPRTV